jgi:hypothetical protein
MCAVSGMGLFGTFSHDLVNVNHLIVRVFMWNLTLKFVNLFSTNNIVSLFHAVFNIDEFWKYQKIVHNYKAEILRTGSRSEVKIK